MRAKAVKVVDGICVKTSFFFRIVTADLQRYVSPGGGPTQNLGASRWKAPCWERVDRDVPLRRLGLLHTNPRHQSVVPQPVSTFFLSLVGGTDDLFLN